MIEGTLRVMLMMIFLVGGSVTRGENATEPVDMSRAKGLLQKQRRGGQLTKDEQAYLERAQAVRKKQRSAKPATQTRDARKGRLPCAGKTSTGITPLSEMAGTASYKHEDGGLYGNGSNTRPERLQASAAKQLAKIRPLDRQGLPADNGKIVLLSIGMSNTTQEFAAFKRAIDQDPPGRHSMLFWSTARRGAERVRVDSEPCRTNMVAT